MIGNAPLSPFTGVPGWESEAEQRLLLELAQAVPADGVIVEIGGEYGMSASLFARGADPSVRIYTVDLFPGDLLAQHRANLGEAGFAKRTEQIQGDSKRIVAGWHEDINLLFVDGDHTYEGVLADLTNWTPFVKQGSVVVMHDVACQTNKLPHALHYEVKRALAEWNSEQDGAWEAANMVDSTVALRRVKETQSELTRDNYIEAETHYAPLEPEPETWADDLDAEVHEAVEPDIYDEPAPKPKARLKGRPKSKK